MDLWASSVSQPPTASAAGAPPLRFLYVTPLAIMAGDLTIKDVRDTTGSPLDLNASEVADMIELEDGRFAKMYVQRR